MKSPFSDYEVSVDFYLFEDANFRVKLNFADASNPTYQRKAQKLVEKHRIASYGKRPIPPTVQNIFLAELIASAVAYDWEVWDEKTSDFVPGFVVGDGIVEKPSAEDVAYVLKNYPPLMASLREAASEISNFQAFDADEDAKN